MSWLSFQYPLDWCLLYLCLLLSIHCTSVHVHVHLHFLLAAQRISSSLQVSQLAWWSSTRTLGRTSRIVSYLVPKQKARNQANDKQIFGVPGNLQILADNVEIRKVHTMTYAERTPDSENAKSIRHGHVHLVNDGEHLPKKRIFANRGFLKVRWLGALAIHSSISPSGALGAKIPAVTFSCCCPVLWSKRIAEVDGSSNTLPHQSVRLSCNHQNSLKNSQHVKTIRPPALCFTALNATGFSWKVSGFRCKEKSQVANESMWHDGGGAFPACLK